MEAWQIEGLLLQAILDKKTVAVITIEGERRSISLSDIRYSEIKNKGEDIIELLPENEKPISLDCETISNIKCL